MSVLLEMWGTIAPIVAADDTVVDTGPSILDWAVVVVLVGAALFVICRGSRRN